MKIKEGDKLPNVKVFVIDMNKEYEHKEISTSEILNKDKIILFGLPGAFTPGCSKKHLPSFLESTEKLKEKNLKNFHFLNYENLVWHTDKEIQKICNFLKVELSIKSQSRSIPSPGLFGRCANPFSTLIGCFRPKLKYS
mgnify:CR=1 FL=1